MLFNILVLTPFLPLFLAAPYNPFPPPGIDLISRSDHGRSGFTPAMLSAYRTAESSETTPVARGLIGGRHYQRGVSMLQSRAVGQGRRSKVRIVKRQAKTCVPISSTSTISASTTSAGRTQLNTIKAPSLTVSLSLGPTSTSAASAAISSTASVPSSSSMSPSPTPVPSTSISSSSSSSAVTTSASIASSASASPIPSPSSASPSASPSPSAVTRITADRNGDGPFSGWGTWYDVGLGACGVWDTPDHPIVAISAELMDNWPGISPGYNPNNHPLCGQHLKITWGGKSTIARVADRCPGCAVRSLDMSKSLFESFATLDVGLLGMDSYTGNITWSWVEGSGALPNLPYTP